MENKLSVEDLMKPRFKIIADYPGNTREIGSITTEIMTASYFRKYPENFKELFWWEERKEIDMPRYVKSRYDGKIHFVERWEHCVFWTCKTEDDREFMQDDVLPATEQEYLTQNK